MEKLEDPREIQDPPEKPETKCGTVKIEESRMLHLSLALGLFVALRSLHLSSGNEE
jgi:hypothetical protein